MAALAFEMVSENLLGAYMALDEQKVRMQARRTIFFNIDYGDKLL